MIPAIRSELRKFFTTRLWWGMAIAIFLAGAAFAGLFGFLLDEAATPADPPASPPGTPPRSPTASTPAGCRSAISCSSRSACCRSARSTGTRRSPARSSPPRGGCGPCSRRSWRCSGSVRCTEWSAWSVRSASAAAVLTLRDRDAFPSSEVVRTLALSLLVLGLWALIGLGIGILIPNQVAALLIGIGVAWIVEPLLGFAMTFWDFGREHIAQFLPSSATNAIVNAVQNSPDEVRLEWWGGALTLTAYAVVLAGFGIWRTTRSDIS